VGEHFDASAEREVRKHLLCLLVVVVFDIDIICGAGE